LGLAEHVEVRASLKEAATSEVTLRILKFKFSEGAETGKGSTDHPEPPVTVAPQHHAGTLAPTRMPASRNSMRASHTRRNVPTTTIAPHLVVATAHTVSHLRQVSPSAAARPAAHSLGGMVLVVMAVTGVFLAAATSGRPGAWPRSSLSSCASRPRCCRPWWCSSP
jgi:hypothetical protein